MDSLADGLSLRTRGPGAVRMRAVVLTLFLAAATAGDLRASGEAPASAPKAADSAATAADPHGPPTVKKAPAKSGDPAATAAFAKAVDWTAWRNLPVLDRGRIKPLDTMAREYVERICGRVSPTIEWEGVPRKFQAHELLWSWTVEPDLWEDVAFIKCEYEPLREELGLPLVDDENKKLLFAAPSDLRDPEKAKKFAERLAEIRKATDKNPDRKLAGTDHFAAETARALTQFHAVAADRTALQRSMNELAKQLPKFFDQVEEHRNEALLLVEQVAPPGEKLSSAALRELRDRWTAAGLKEKIEGLSAKGRADSAACYAAVVELARALAAERESLVGLFTAAHSEAARDPDFAARWKPAQELYGRHLKEFERLAAAMTTLRGMMFDNTKPFRVLPATEEEALKDDREEGGASPWIDLESILHAPQQFLVDKGFPAAELGAVRVAFEQSVDAWKTQDAAVFSAGLLRFARDMRSLGEKLNGVQVEIARKLGTDEELLVAVAYPPESRMTTETFYNRFDPFFKAMICYGLAVTCLLVAWGPFRHAMTALGAAGLLGGLGFSVFGFGLRIAISRYAPVTNMYETIVYVACVCAALALWFMLLPTLWEGLQHGWRLSGMPGTPEAGPSKAAVPAGEAVPPPASLDALVALGLQLPRLALAGLCLWLLAIVPYAAGGQTIISLWPKPALGGGMPNLNNFVVWGVGWGVLLTVMYYVPRLLLALVAGLVTVPLSLMKDGTRLLGKISEFPRPLIGLGGATASFLAAAIAWQSPSEMVDKNVQQLTPILRDNVWLTIHVMTIVASYAAGALAWGVGNLSLLCYVFGSYRGTKAGRSADEPAVTPDEGHGAFRAPQICTVLAGYIYRVIQVAVVLLAAGTILGGLWADVSWGRFWGWDPKEVWALISLLAYLAVLHARYAGLIGNFGLAAGAVLGFTAIIMSWYGVNFVLGAGLHAYAFGSGGQLQVFGLVLANWVLVGVAAARYGAEVHVAVPHGPTAGLAGNPPTPSKT